MDGVLVASKFPNGYPESLDVMTTPGSGWPYAPDPDNAGRSSTDARE